MRVKRLLMPRHSTLPTIYDECKTLEIGFLKKHGYLKPNNDQSGTVTWSRNGQVTSSISIRVKNDSIEGVMHLSYKCNGNDVEYSVRIIATRSNLGKGYLLYFLCPFTGKTCRKLYLIGGKFCHREAARGCFYEKQTMSKSIRQMIGLYEMHFIADKVYEERFKKYFKPTYNGKPTKRMLKLQEKLALYQRVKYVTPSVEQLLTRLCR